jgi:CubicO group peptidase (beta-lactamase class C family)
MKKHILVFIFISIWTSSFITAQRIIYSTEVEKRISQVENSLTGWVLTGDNDYWSLADRMQKYKINGLSIAVIHNYDIEWARGYGFADIREKRPVTENTLFQAASISKSLNSLGVLKLVQEKKLDLNKDINEYLITWKFPYDEKYGKTPITITNLLSHTAGLTVSGFPGYEKGDTLPALQQILDGQNPANTGPVRSILEPGKKFIYSGGGITITQLIVTDITGQPYDVFMKKNVLDPLGMKSSSFTQPPASAKRKMFATGYKTDGTEYEGKYHIYPEQAAAGLWTTPSDLCRYIIETQLSFGGKSSKVLTPEMTRLRLKTVHDDAALGVFVNSRVTGSFKYFNHNGGNAGFCCTAIGCLNAGEGVVIMTNTDYNNNGILEEIANSVASVYKWKDYYLPETKKVVDVDSSLLKKYQGKYNMGGRIISFKMSDDELLVNVFEDQYWKVYFASVNEFFIKEFRGSFEFVTDDNNNVTGFSGNGIVAKKMKE